MEETKNYLKSEIQRLENDIIESQKLLEVENSAELKELITEEIEKLKSQKNELSKSLNALEGNYETSESDAVSNINLNKNIVILEIRAGTGGDEAGLFADDLYQMYTRYADKKGWKVEELFKSENEVGGIKTVSAEIRGLGTYDLLKNESGVHRVQRVPSTESGGRVHTSTATVAILPQLKKIDLEIKPEELKWEFFRAGGHGGQNVNKVSTAVRLIHLPTNTIVECQEERSQGKNREKALNMLNSKLYKMMEEQQVKSLTELRSTQIGTGERSEKIRTYNYPQDRVTDHRLEKSWFGMENIMLGNLDNILESFDENTEPQEV